MLFSSTFRSFDAADTYESIISSVDSQPISDSCINMKSEVQDVITDQNVNNQPSNIEIKCKHFLNFSLLFVIFSTIDDNYSNIPLIRTNWTF